MQNNMIKRMIYTTLAAVCLTSCMYDVDEILLSRSDISLTIKGELKMAFDENTCQLGYNTERNEFRVYDEKLADYFIVRCSAKPDSEGQKLIVDLEYTTQTDVKAMKGLELSVEKTSSGGLVWLWSKERKIGIIIKNL